MTTIKAFITDYPKYCLLCGAPKIEDHHLLKGAVRSLADADGIYIPICRKCHDEIHSNGTAEKLGKILGQALWELNYISETKGEIVNARDNFRRRYSKSYL